MKNQEFSDWQIFLFFMRYLKPLWDKVLLVLLLAMVLTVLDINTIILPLVMRKFMDQVLPQQDWHLFKILLIVIVCQIILYLFFNMLSELVKYVLSLKLGFKLGMDVFKHILKLPLSFFQQRPIGEHMYRTGTLFDPGFANLAILALLFETTGTAKGTSQPVMGNDVDGVLGMITQSLDLIIRVTFRLVLILFTISVGFSAGVGLALLLFCVPYIWGIHWFYNYQRRIDFRFREKSQNFMAGLQEWFAGIKTVKAFGKGQAKFGENISLFIQMLRVDWQNYFMKLSTDNFIFFFKYLFITGAIFYICVTQKPTAGAVFGLYLLLDQFFSPINLYIRVIEGIRLQLIPGRRLMETLAQVPTITEHPNAKALPQFAGPYHFQNVDFAYVPEKPVLQNIRLEIPRGQRVAIVGPSGSGKTSLANLVMRLYDPASGEILAEDVNLKNLQLGSYYENIGIILQDNFLFSGTVRENIRYGKPNATDAEIMAAAKQAAVHRDILALPEGYDTDLAEGTKLSGGQKQRISIARALIRQPSILILDEATSALDSETARQIEETLFDISSGKTVIMITHKLASVRNFDRIFVIHKGKLIEQGTFNDLMQWQGFFADLYQQQMRF